MKSSLLRHLVPTLLLTGGVLVLLAGGGFAALESRTVSSYWEGVWWALSLMTTVGFVGETPETTGGRLISAVLMLSGFALMTLTTAAVASLFVHEEERPAEASEREFEIAVLAVLERLTARVEAVESLLTAPSDEPTGAEEPPA